MTERQENERKLIDRLERLTQEKNAGSTTVEAHFYEIVSEFLSCLKGCTVSGWRRLSRCQAVARKFKANSVRVREQVMELRALADLWQLYEVQLLSEPWKREFVEMVFKFKQRLEEEKKKASTCDFEDLLLFVYRALSGSSDKERLFRAHLREQFSYILVDEYQDTSPLQAKIISLLKRPDNLFVVGDVRQSIYGFRHADPDVFIQAAQSSENVLLAENYRARPELLDFVNRFSSRLFSGQYQGLKPVLKFGGKKDHVVEIIRVPKEENKDLSACRVMEARTIASRIRDLTDMGFAVEEKNGKTRPANYRDFAILMKGTTSSRLYEKELEAFSIPYYAHKGRGFYEKMEVADLLNALRVLENPRHDIAFASVLRSPLVQAGDDALFWLAQASSARKKEVFCDGLENLDEIPELSARDREKLAHFKSWMDDLRKDKDRLKISEILQRITDETAYEAKLLTRDGAFQARANVQKLHEIARAVEEKGISGIEDFVLYLQSLSEREVTEPEARILGEAENVVRILTIHAAKGLEFPCVILADMGAKTRSNEGRYFYVDPARGLGAKVKNPVDLEFYRDKTYAELEESFARKQREEQKRLFYVAMTRAKEHLILSGVSTDNSWMGETLQLLGLEADASLPQRVEFEGIPIEVTPICRTPAPKKEKNRIFLADDPKVKEGFLSGAALNSGAEPAAVTKLKKSLKPVVKLYETLEDLSVTQLLTAFQGDDRISRNRQEEFGVDAEFAPPRNEFGTVFHKIMETAAAYRPRGFWQENLFSRWMKTFNDSEKSEIHASFKRFWEGKWGQAIGEATHCYTELPFIFKTRHGILKGQIDLVFQDKNAEWVILDYKTNRISEKELDAVAQTYAWQLALYALVFQRLYGEAPKCGVLYFSTLHHAQEFYYAEKDFARFDSELETRYRRCVLQSDPV